MTTGKKQPERPTFYADNAEVRFIPIAGGEYTHRVIINGMARDWLSWRYVPGQAAARYFAARHIRHVEQPRWLECATRREKWVAPWRQEAFARWLLKRQFAIVGKEGNWRCLPILPLEQYIAEMEAAGRWKRGQFLVHGIYVNRCQWMDRFNHYIESLGKESLILKDLYGWQVREMFLNRSVWDNKQYDASPLWS